MESKPTKKPTNNNNSFLLSDLFSASYQQRKITPAESQTQRSDRESNHHPIKTSIASDRGFFVGSCPSKSNQLCLSEVL